MTDKPDISLGKCDVCKLNDAAGVAAVPGIPMSITWCQTCLREGCYGPYELHWINLASMTLEEDDTKKIHAEIIQQMEAGQIADWAIEMIVWRNGYKTMLEALKEGPPDEQQPDSSQETGS